MKFNSDYLADHPNLSESAIENQLEALKVLSETLLREVEALRSKTKSEEEITSDVVKGKIDLDEEVKNYEMELIRCALIRTGGRQRRAARLLNVKISTLNAKIKRYNIDWYGVTRNV
jgi:DNA-binding NtrC family response regulator